MPVASRMRSAWKPLAASAAAILGIVSGLASLFPIFWWWTWLLAGLAALLVTWIVILHRARPAQIPIDSVLGDPDSSDGRVVLEIAPGHDMLVTANLHAHELYRRDSLELAEVERWSAKNPLIFGVLRGEHGEYLGYFDILPLTPEGDQLLRSGHVNERDLRPDYILPPHSMAHAKSLYLAGVAVRDCGTEAGKRRFAQMCGGLAEYIHRYYGDKDRTIIALAATPSGERVLHKSGASITCSKEARKNEHDLYQIHLTPELLNRLKMRAAARARPATLLAGARAPT